MLSSSCNATLFSLPLARSKWDELNDTYFPGDCIKLSHQSTYFHKFHLEEKKRYNAVSTSDRKLSAEWAHSSKPKAFQLSQTPGLRPVYLTYNHLRIWGLDPDKTTNFETQNYAKSPQKNHAEDHEAGSKIIWMDRRKKDKVRDIMETISILKWTWAGHVVRRTDNWCTKNAASSGRPGACFSKVPKLFGRILGDIILFVSSKRRRLEARNFPVIFIFIPFATYEKTSFTK